MQIKTNNFIISIVEVMGILDSGISVLLSIEYINKFYEATYWYNTETSFITINDLLEEKIGNISEHDEYQYMLDELKKMFPIENFEKLQSELKDMDVNIESYIKFYLDKNNLTQ